MPLDPSTIEALQKAGLIPAPSIQLKEPGGPAQWTIREQKDFLAAINERTGDVGKIRVDKLSPAEKKEVQAPHGAGPLPIRAHDLSVGASPGYGLMAGQNGGPQALNVLANEQAENTALRNQTKSGPGQATSTQYADLPVGQQDAAPLDPPLPPPPDPTADGVQHGQQASGSASIPIAEDDPNAPGFLEKYGKYIPAAIGMQVAGPWGAAALLPQTGGALVSPPTPTPVPLSTPGAPTGGVSGNISPVTGARFVARAPDPLGSQVAGVARPAGFDPTTKSVETESKDLSPDQKAGLIDADSRTELGRKMAIAEAKAKPEIDRLTEKEAQQEAALADFQAQNGTFVEPTQLELDRKARGYLDTGVAKNESDAQELARETTKGHYVGGQEQKAQAERDALAEEKGKRDAAHAEAELRMMEGPDPGRFYNNKSLGGKIATTLSLIAGRLTGGHHFQDEFNRDRDLDIKAQMAAIDGKQQDAKDADSHYALFVKQGMEKAQAEAAAKTLATHQVMQQIAAKQKETQDPLAKLTLGDLYQKLGAQQQKEMLDEIKVTAPIVKRKADFKYHTALAAGAGVPDLHKAYAAYVDTGLKWNAEHPDKPVNILPSSQWAAARKGEGYSAVGAGGGKTNPLSVPLANALAEPVTGEGAGGRAGSYPSWLRGSEGLANEAKLATLVRAYVAANKLPVKRGASSQELIQQFVGRPTDDNVAAFVKKAQRELPDIEHLDLSKVPDIQEVE